MRNVVWMDTVTVNGEDLRLGMGAWLAPSDDTNLMASREGVRASTGDLKVTAQSAPNNTVVIAPGRCIVNGDSTTTQGPYVCTSDTAVTFGPFADPNRTQTRIDLVVVKVYDSEYIGGSQKLGAIEIVQGTPQATPVAPAVPANAIPIAQVTITTHATGGAVIGAADIKDVRQFTSALGGVIPCGSTTRPGNPYNGMVIYETDTDRVMVWSGGVWNRVGGRKNPRGVIAQRKLYTPLSGTNHVAVSPTTTEVQIMSTTGVVDGTDRFVKITLNALVVVNTADTRVVLQVRDGSLSGTVLLQNYRELHVANQAEHVSNTTYVTNLSAGSHTFVCTLDVATGTGNAYVYGSSNFNHGIHLIVEDIGIM